MSERRPSAPRAVVALFVLIIAYCVTFCLLLAAAAWAEVVPPEMPRNAIPLFVATVLGLPLILAMALARVLRRKGWLPSGWLRGRALTVVVLLYVLTAVFGVPAVQTHENTWAVEEYKRDKASGNVRVWSSHPYIATYFAAPILPGLVVTYHEYQLDGLYGF